MSKNISFFEARTIYQKTHGQRVMSYAGVAKAPIQRTCIQTNISWVGAQPGARKQRPAASVTSRPVPSVSRSVGTTTRVADVQKPVAPAKSSPPKKDQTSSKPFRQSNTIHLLMSLMPILPLKQIREKVKRVPL